MKPFLFVFDITPTAAAQNAADIAGGIAHIWVLDTDKSSAESRARALMLDMGWLITGLEHALEPSAEQIADLDTREAHNHRQALARGIWPDLIVWPKAAWPDGTSEMRSLTLPDDDQKKH